MTGISENAQTGTFVDEKIGPTLMPLARRTWRGFSLAASGLLALGGFVLGNPKGQWHHAAAGFIALAMAFLFGIIGLADAAPGLIATSSLPRSLPRSQSRFSQRSLILSLLLGVLLVVHAGMAVHKVRMTPGDTIDTFTFQRDAVVSLLQGINPYGGTHANIYTPEQTREFYAPQLVVDNRIQVGLQYPPLTFLCAIPGYLLGDVRFGFVLAIMGSAILVVAAVPDFGGLILAALILLNRVTFQVEVRTWTEPLVWMMLCATMYAAIKKPRYLPLALGLFLASKQYNFLALPLIGFLLPSFSWRAYAKLLLQSLLVAVATVLPFAIWNFRALWHDLVLFHLAQPMRLDAVSFATLFPGMLKVGPVLLLVFILWCVQQSKPNATIFLPGYGMALLIFFSTGKQAFLNYYYLICYAFLFAALLAFQARPGTTTRPVHPAA